MSSATVVDLGRRIAAARLQRGLSQGTVARQAGLAASYLSRIENGRVHPTFRTVMKIAEGLRVPIEEIARPVPSRAGRGPCPVTRRGHCLLDLIRPESSEDDDEDNGEIYTPRQIGILRRLAVWMHAAPPDRLRVMEVLLEDLSRGVPDSTRD